MRLLAFFKLTSGYTPSESVLCFPSKRYLKRHHLPPAGVTIRNSPRSWYSLNGFAPGLTLRSAVSVRGIWGNCVSQAGFTPKSYPS